MDSTGKTRRDVVKTGGGLALTVIGWLVVGGPPSVLAQAASLVVAAGDGLEGRYVAVRARTLQDPHSAAEVLGIIGEGYVPLLREISGFVAYLGVADPASRQLAFISVFGNKAGADEATRQAGAWWRDNNYDFFAGDPIVVEGPIGSAAGTFPDGGMMATPSAGDGQAGKYVVIRCRQVVPGRSGAALLELIREGFVPLLTDVPGFIAYVAVANEETGNQFISIGVYGDAAAAAESTRLAATWGEEGAAEYVTGDPTVIEGIIGLAVAG